MPSSTFECMQCGSTAGTLRFEDCQDYYLNKPHRPDYYQCKDCELVQQSPVPDDVGSFYDQYPIHQRKSFFHRAFRSMVMKSSYFNLGKFLKRVGGQEPLLLVDFGCGDGWFLEDCARFEISRVGYELDPAVAEHLGDTLSIPVYSSEQALIEDYSGKADVVTMHFVMEHVTDLNRTFEVIGKLLKPGGTFHFVVPNIASWEAKFFGTKWHGLDAPRHISFPSIKSVMQLAERWGFDVAAETPSPFPNGIAGSLPVVATGRFRFPLFLASLPIGIVLSRLFPTGSMAYRLVRA